MSEERTSPYPEFDDLTIPQLATAMKGIQQELEASKEITTSLQKRYDYIRKNLLPEKMENEGIASVKIVGVGRISLRPEAYTQTMDAKELLRWMIANGFEDLIKETINPSTLKAFAKEQVKKGEPLPPEEVFKFTPFMMATISSK